MIVVLLSQLAAQTPAGYKPPKACAPFSTDDGSVENCEAWCSELYSGNHCPRCSCKTCGFCVQPPVVPAAVTTVATASAIVAPPPTTTKGAPCSSGRKTDLSFEACEASCSFKHSTSACDFCRCRGCDGCAEYKLLNAKS